jgi:haloalkane dehalogenase
MPPVAQIEPSLQELFPFRPRFVRLNGFDLHYVDEGRGEVIVMLHGNPTWSFYYRRLAGSLSETCRVIVPDHIGCGLSEKPPAHRYGYRLQNRIDDLESLLDRLAPNDRLTLVLHDWGGMIGAAYALRHPHRIARLVITNTAAFLPPGDKKLPWRLKLIRNVKPLGALLVQGLNAFAQGAAYMASHKGLCPQVRKGLLFPYDSWPHRIATLKFVQDIPLGAGDPSFEIVRQADRDLHRLSHLPTLLCWGLRDFVFDRDYLFEWQRRFPRAEVHAFEDAGHYLLEDVPEKVVPLVQRFLENHPLT